MEKALLDIAELLKSVDYLDERTLTKVINRHNKRILEEAKYAMRPSGASPCDSRPSTSCRSNATKPTLDATGAKKNPARPLSKRHLMAFYLETKRHDPQRWAQWGLTEEQQQRIERTLQMKPRRTASGVATITVLTKPWKCSSNCLYCPNDLRMPKSYLSDEPACQRAERTFFDPYLQVSARLKALTEMGHVTDKIELIILGGTWSDYPLGYQIWFVRELFRALNTYEQDTETIEKITTRHTAYERAGISNDIDTLIDQTSALQQRIFEGELTYNQAFDIQYGNSDAWKEVARWQSATWDELETEHRINESAKYRVVGLVIETRPERLDPDHALSLRRLGCTKVQMGIQSLHDSVRKQNDRHVSTAQIQRAFETLRLLGFKTHIHAMVNLLGSTPELDKKDYEKLVTDTPFQPDEIKLYPCVLVNGTGLCDRYRDGSWQPYPEEELIDVLVADTCATPAFTRISRMIRDISAPDIVAGNKKVNLRQIVESRIDKGGYETKEIRHREVSLAHISVADLHLEVISYKTSVTDEHFLQWVTSEGKIAGFLRLSLPEPGAIGRLRRSLQDNTPLPLSEGDAMIREVHVYGRVAKLTKQGSGAQHHGLGTQLIERACHLAREKGYERINVISAIGTRDYYRKLHFHDIGLYQQRDLTD